jgi:hypothetical protein
MFTRSPEPLDKYSRFERCAAFLFIKIPPTDFAHNALILPWPIR